MMWSNLLKFPEKRLLIGLGGWLLLVFIAAAIGAVASVDAGTFYRDLIRPAWAPPGWLFGPVWSVLYFLMGIAAWLVWRIHGFKNARLALTTFILQLAVNALWSWLFFAWRLGAAAFVEILVLLSLILATIILFWRLGIQSAALLLLPYMAWVIFATFLTLSIWQLNPELLN